MMFFKYTTIGSGSLFSRKIFSIHNFHSTRSRFKQSHIHTDYNTCSSIPVFYIHFVNQFSSHFFSSLRRSGVGTVFCLPWLITWYAHTLSDYRNVVRLYDFFLATPYLMPMYIAVAIVLHREQDILSGECDMAMQHYILSQVSLILVFYQ